VLQVYVSFGVCHLCHFFFARDSSIKLLLTRRDVRQENIALETVNKELRRAHYIPFIV
jgi:hypothetical protein